MYHSNPEAMESKHFQRLPFSPRFVLSGRDHTHTTMLEGHVHKKFQIHVLDLFLHVGFRTGSFV